MNWRTSSYSGQGGGNCIEVGHGQDAVLVRDTKDYSHGQVHKFTNEEWRAFVSQVTNIDAELRLAKGGQSVAAAGPPFGVRRGIPQAIAGQLAATATRWLERSGCAMD